MHADSKAQKYVEEVRDSLISEYSLDQQTDEVALGNYHMGMIVISFKARPSVEYPYCYKGIQLKPWISPSPAQ